MKLFEIVLSTKDRVVIDEFDFDFTCIFACILALCLLYAWVCEKDQEEKISDES